MITSVRDFSSPHHITPCFVLFASLQRDKRQLEKVILPAPGVLPSQPQQVLRGLLKPQVAKTTIHHWQSLCLSGARSPSKACCQPHSSEPAATRLPGRGIWERYSRGQLRFHRLMYFHGSSPCTLHWYLYNHLKTEFGGFGGLTPVA